MRYALLADIHANLSALEAVVADALAHNVGHMVCIGDIVGYGPQPLETLARVRTLTHSICMGNHDAAACGILKTTYFNSFARETIDRAAIALSFSDKKMLRDLPYILEGDGFACAHASFNDPEQFYYLETKEDAAASFASKPDTPLLVVAHTHIPAIFVRNPQGEIRKLPAEDFTFRPGHRYIINPGSVGFPRSENIAATYAIYDSMTRRVLFRNVPYDHTSYRLAIVRGGYNLMNYWFLSPTATRHQAERAFEAPRHPAEEQLVYDYAGFGVQHKSNHISLLFVVLLIAFLFASIGGTALILHLQPQSTVQKVEPGSLLPPFDQWQGLEGIRLQNATSFTVTSTALTHHTLISPNIELPQGATKLRLSQAIQLHRPEDRANAPTLRINFTFYATTGKLDTVTKTYKVSSKNRTATIRIPTGAKTVTVQIQLDTLGATALSNVQLLPEY